MKKSLLLFSIIFFISCQDNSSNNPPINTELCFEEKSNFAPSPNGYGYISGPRIVDLDRDGNLDVLVASDNGLNLVRGQGNGNFFSPNVLLNGTTVISNAFNTADFNNDGILDIVSGVWCNVVGGNCQGDYYARILFGLGNNSFNINSPMDVSVGPYVQGDTWILYSLEVLDFNNDGNMDFAVSGHYHDAVTIVLGNGDGTFRPAIEVFDGNTATAIVVGDFDNNGTDDIITNYGDLIKYSNGTAFVTNLLSTGSNNWFNCITKSPRASDLNNDGNLDIVSADSYGSGDVVIALGNGDGTFQNSYNYPPSLGYAANAIEIGDFNGDGNNDIAVCSYNYQQVYSRFSVLKGDGTGFFGTPTNFVSTNITSYAYMRSADFDNDGDLDIFIAGINYLTCISNCNIP